MLVNWSTEKQMKDLVNEGIPKCKDSFEVYIVIDD